MEQLTTPAQRGLARKRYRMDKHAAAKLRLNHRRRAGVKAYTLPLHAASLEAWLRSMGRLPATGTVEKAEIEAALVSVISEAMQSIKI
jgi:hypothetical protein